ncbi:MAG: nuclear transport factor 2 family protein [Acidobacteriota bacterium]
MPSNIRRTVLAAAVIVGSGAFSLVAAQGQAGKPMTLTALDYIEIQQLVNKYSWAIDNCTNNGYDYADLFTPDGIFYWGVGSRKSVGREQLAEAAGGGKTGCAKVAGATAEKPLQTHVALNLVIEPTPEGAIGKTYLVYPGIGGITGDSTHTGHVGGYQDVYVKAAGGWRFKSRLHVFPPLVTGTVKDFENLPAPARRGGPPAGAAAK